MRQLSLQTTFRGSTLISKWRDFLLPCVSLTQFLHEMTSRSNSNTKFLVILHEVVIRGVFEDLY